MKSFLFTILIALSLVAYANAAPVALWVSDPVQPGQTVLVFGDGFTGCKSVQVTRLANTSNEARARSAQVKALDKTVTVAPVQVRPKSVKFVIPATFKTGVFAATIATPSGTTSILINRPQILWTQGDAGSSCTPAGTLRVTGKCLTSGGQPATLRIYNGASGWNLKPSRQSQFSLEAALPTAIKPGPYQLLVNSNSGGEPAISERASIQVVARLQQPTYQVMVNSLGASADDVDDDTPAIQEAIDTVGRHGGGTVLFGRGRYVLSDQLTLPPHVTLRGAGMNLTALCWGDTPSPPDALIRGSGHFAVQDLTLYAINYQHGIVGDQTGPNAGHVHIRQVRLRLNPYRGHLTPEEVDKRFVASLKLSTGGGDSLRLGGEDVEVAGCDVYGAGRCLYLSRGTGAWIHGNTFYNGRWGWYCISGSNGVIFERNQITGGDLMSTGGGLNCLDGSNVSQNVYYANNTLKNMFGWDREAMTTDAGGGAYYAKAQGAQGKELTLADEPKWNQRDWTGAGVFILDGKGQGQYRQIEQAAGRRVVVDKPWLIPPDSTSTITITMLQRNYLFINNAFADAGVAIQMYGTAVGNIAYGNVSARTAGFHNFGMNYDGIQPSWFVQWLHNRISEGNVYGGGHDQNMAVGEAHLGVFALPPGGTLDAPLTLCVVVRDNVLQNNAQLAVGGSDPPNPSLTYPYVQEVVVEGNRVEQATVGLRIARAAAGVYARHNTFIGCAADVVDDISLDRKAAAVRRKLYAEPGPLLHLTFDQLAGHTFRDISGHGFDARCQGPCTPVPVGAKGGAVSLDGASYLMIGHPDWLKMESFTLAAWIKTDHLAGRWGFISKRVGNTTAPFVFGETNGALAFEATDTHGAWSFNTESPPVLQTGVWQHVTAVLQAGVGVTLYLNGKEVAHKANPGTVQQNDEPLTIGHEAWGGDPPVQAPAFFKGSLDDVQIWPRALSAAEVAKLAGH